MKETTTELCNCAPPIVTDDDPKLIASDIIIGDDEEVSRGATVDGAEFRSPTTTTTVSPSPNSNVTIATTKAPSSSPATSKWTPTKKTATDEGDALIEEEIVDGIAILSFRSVEDLNAWIKEQDERRKLREVAERPPAPPPLVKPKKPRRHRQSTLSPLTSKSSSSIDHHTGVTLHKQQIVQPTSGAGDVDACYPMMMMTSEMQTAAASGNSMPSLKRPLSVNDGVPTSKMAKVEPLDNDQHHKNGLITTKNADRLIGADCSSSASYYPTTTMGSKIENGHSPTTFDFKSTLMSNNNVETSHPVDPGHPPTSLFVHTTSLLPSTSTSLTATTVSSSSSAPNILSSSAAVAGNNNTTSHLLGGGVGALLAADHPLRQAFLSHPQLGAAGFANPYLAAAPGFPLFSLLPAFLQQQQMQQQLQQQQPVSSIDTGGGHLRASNVPPQLTIGQQLATAALAGVRPPQIPTTSAANSTPASNTTGGFTSKKRGKWCAMHVRIAWDISHKLFSPPSTTTHNHAATPQSTKSAATPTIGFTPSGSTPTTTNSAHSSADVKSTRNNNSHHHRHRRPSPNHRTSNAASTTTTTATPSSSHHQFPSTSSASSVCNGGGAGHQPSIAAADALNAIAAATYAGFPSNASAMQQYIAAATAAVATSQPSAYSSSSHNPFLINPALFAATGQQQQQSTQQQRLFDPMLMPPGAGGGGGFSFADLIGAGRSAPSSLDAALRMQIEQQQLLERFGSFPIDREMLYRHQQQQQQQQMAMLSAQLRPPQHQQQLSFESLMELQRQQSAIAALNRFGQQQQSPAGNFSAAVSGLVPSQMYTSPSTMIGLPSNAATYGGGTKTPLPFSSGLEQLAARQKRADGAPSNDLLQQHSTTNR